MLLLQAMGHTQFIYIYMIIYVYKNHMISPMVRPVYHQMGLEDFGERPFRDETAKGEDHHARRARMGFGARMG